MSAHEEIVKTELNSKTDIQISAFLIPFNSYIQRRFRNDFDMEFKMWFGVSAHPQSHVKTDPLVFFLSY